MLEKDVCMGMCVYIIATLKVANLGASSISQFCLISIDYSNGPSYFKPLLNLFGNSLTQWGKFLDLGS